MKVGGNMGKYIQIDISDLDKLQKRLGQAAQGDFKKMLTNFLEGLGYECLKIVQDEIIRKGSTDTRILLNSFNIGDPGNIFILYEGDLTIEIGTNLEYASYINDGHWTNTKGQEKRWVPGYWRGERFVYDPTAKTGMLLKQKWIEGTHYWESAIRAMDKMLPGILEKKVQQWLDKYFSEFI